MTATANPVRRIDLPLPLVRRGKVRDVYEIDAGRLLLVASDRVSAFDVVMAEAVPHKGAVLTQLTAWWLSRIATDIDHHLITSHVEGIVEAVPSLAPMRDLLVGRAMLVKKTTVFPVECVMRGYISGSAWKEYGAGLPVAGHRLKPGLRESDRFDAPLFTPATKAESGHDENISFEHAAGLVGKALAETVRAVSLEIYRRAAKYAEPRGVILADTKFEFGMLDGQLIWIDEAVTPDSSRFWPAAQYKPGGPQPSFDKQFVRDYLEQIRWPKTPPGPELPEQIVAATRAKYREAYRILTGEELN